MRSRKADSPARSRESRRWRCARVSLDAARRLTVGAHRLTRDRPANLEALNACLKHASESGRGATFSSAISSGTAPIRNGRRHRRALRVRGRGRRQGQSRRGGRQDARLHERIGARRHRLDPREPLRREPRVSLLVAAVRPRRVDVLRPRFRRGAGALGLHRQPRGRARSIDAAQAAYTFSGHVHDQELYFQGDDGKMFDVPTGARPRRPRGTPSPLARARRFGRPAARQQSRRGVRPVRHRARKIVFRRVAYDHLAAARKIRDAGLPASIAHRVEKGI